MKVLTLRLPDSLWQRIRRVAFDTEQRYNALCVQALERYLSDVSRESDVIPERRVGNGE